jgi:hypothetical protein
MARLWVSQSKGCWVDLFESPGFAGKRLRLFGPADYVNLWIGPAEWGDEVHSMIAGPCAYVQCFEELNFKESAVWLVPNQRVPLVADLPTREEMDSIRLFDRPPFACEPGFEAYAGWHGMPPEAP